jgi:hypothetical protein
VKDLGVIKLAEFGQSSAGDTFLLETIPSNFDSADRSDHMVEVELRIGGFIVSQSRSGWGGRRNAGQASFALLRSPAVHFGLGTAVRPRAVRDAAIAGTSADDRGQRGTAAQLVRRQSRGSSAIIRERGHLGPGG